MDHDHYLRVHVFWPAPPEGAPDGEVGGRPYHEERAELDGHTRIDGYVELTRVPGRTGPVTMHITAFDTFDFRPAIEHVLENVEIL
ncbi:hypothetical protein ACFQV2_23610 [Actinokineospora soli]|uniref:Uncharacterized protein n=1 Tax=Actinokineospora soli TaxID=1048753 RepID=A0ABW2TS68_9PSEU